MTTLRHRPSNLSLIALLALIGFTDLAVDRLASGAALIPVKVVLLAAILAYGVLVVGLSRAELGLEPSNAGRGLVYGLGAAAVICGVLVVLLLVPSSRAHFLTSGVAMNSPTQHWLRPLIEIPLGTAVFEETIFRGVLLGAALRRWSAPVAVTVTSVAFGLWHLPVAAGSPGLSGAGTPAALAGTFLATSVAGVAFGWLRLRSDSLVAPILGHVATDSGAYVAVLVAVRLWG